MEVGLKESSKKKLVRSTWAGHVERLLDDKLAEGRCSESEEEMETRKSEIAMEYCIKSDIERVGEEWKKLSIEGI